jgi:hypothetical protein
VNFTNWQKIIIFILIDPTHPLIKNSFQEKKDHHTMLSSSSSSSTGTTAHCGLCPVEQDPLIFSYLTNSLHHR